MRKLGSESPEAFSNRPYQTRRFISELRNVESKGKRREVDVSTLVTVAVASGCCKSERSVLKISKVEPSLMP